MQNASWNPADHAVSVAPLLKRNSSTPWGIADAVSMLVPGLYRVCTPGHGGYALSPAMLLHLCNIDGSQGPKTIDFSQRIIKRLFVHRNNGMMKSEGMFWYWFEEDCDWAIVCLLVAKNGSPAVKEAYFHNIGEREKEMMGAAWCTIQNFHPDLQEDLSLPGPKGWTEIEGD